MTADRETVEKEIEQFGAQCEVCKYHLHNGSERKQRGSVIARSPAFCVSPRSFEVELHV